MALVTYSDSEASENEQPTVSIKAASPAPSKPPTFQKVVDRSNPRKIHVNLSESKPGVGQTNSENEERPSKRARVGGGAFSGFNSLLPAPKRQAAERKEMGNGVARKVFSLKTGAEPGFDREGDAELKALFAEENANTNQATTSDLHKSGSQIDGPGARPPSASSIVTDRRTNGNATMFKPLSVARNSKKKKTSTLNTGQTQATTATGDVSPDNPESQQSEPRLSLFSLGQTGSQTFPVSSEERPYEPMIERREEPHREDYEDEEEGDIGKPFAPQNGAKTTVLGDQGQIQGTQSLDSIASDLNLSESARRQLFGRHGSKSAANAVNVVNFNTDDEYAANEALRANGEQVQHNPVKAIAPGKHSLRQLVTAASGQKDALEESFAAGRRNKKEAGNKYGW